mgnify:CR=1 FL=1
MAGKGILATIGAILGDVGRAQEAARTYDKLNALGDERLAARGLNRDDLVTTVFGKAFETTRG